ncbi:MAG: TetR/AcrR family transcriptional regulator [Alphaproteobacteria bacterium]|nr:TetR/AcrR family transcriptional regulator [Alphaproteobacteria bacterium]
MAAAEDRAPGSDTGAAPAHTKATRGDWIASALDTLISHGVDSVKVLTLADRLGVSRSSFYWYFKNREELLDALLAHWQDTNTRGIVAQAEARSGSIVEGVANVFRCWIDERLFDPRLDFAVRDWARRSDRVRDELHRADDVRVAAIAGLYRRHGWEEVEAFVRARVLYFMQIGYYALDLGESLARRKELTAHYLKSFTGQDPTAAELDPFMAWIGEMARG